MHAVTAEGDGLEHEQHPSRQVRIGVLVAADLPAQLVEQDLTAEDLLGTRRPSAESFRDFLNRRQSVSRGAASSTMRSYPQSTASGGTEAG